MGDGGHSPPDLSPELLQHIERQCALWEGICQRVSHNVTLLGTDAESCHQRPLTAAGLFQFKPENERSTCPAADQP